MCCKYNYDYLSLVIFNPPPQYHINKLSLSEPQTMTSSPAMDDLDSALQGLEVKLDGADSSPQDMLVRTLWLFIPPDRNMSHNILHCEVRIYVFVNMYFSYVFDFR